MVNRVKIANKIRKLLGIILICFSIAYVVVGLSNNLQSIFTYCYWEKNEWMVDEDIKEYIAGFDKMIQNSVENSPELAKIHKDYPSGIGFFLKQTHEGLETISTLELSIILGVTFGILVYLLAEKGITLKFVIMSYICAILVVGFIPNTLTHASNGLVFNLELAIATVVILTVVFISFYINQQSKAREMNKELNKIKK